MIACSVLSCLALLSHVQAAPRDPDEIPVGQIPVGQIVDLMVDQAGTPCVAFEATWGLAVAPVDSIGLRFTVPQGEVFILTDVEWAFGDVDPANPPLLSLGSDFSTHFWTPFLQLAGGSLIGNTLAGNAHFSTGVVVTSHDATSAFCVVGSKKPVSFNAQGYFTNEEAPGSTGR
jgi:hypothetical protein